MVFISSFLGCPKWGNFLCVVLVLVLVVSCKWLVLVPAGQWIPAVCTNNYLLFKYLQFFVCGVIIHGESTGMWVRGRKKSHNPTGVMFYRTDIRTKKFDADASFFVQKTRPFLFSLGRGAVGYTIGESFPKGRRGHCWI